MSRNLRVKSVVLDSCFLITLCDARRPNHETAKKYFKFWVEHGNLMLVPTICLSEYWTREPNLPTSVMEHVKVKSFNVEDAAIASKLIREKIVVREGEQRDIFKDDVKIVGSACALKAVAIATEDVKTMARYVARVSKKCPEANGLRAVLISQPFNTGTAEFGDPTFPNM